MSKSGDLEVAVTTTPVKAPKMKKVALPKVKVASKKTPAAHPPTSQMVRSAIKNLKDRGGSSLQAIKKYIAGTYKVDAEKLAPFIKKYLKSAVDSGALIRTKGKGASGSFKLAPSKAETEKKAKKPKTEKKKVVKAAGEKKQVAKPKKAVATTPKKPKAPAKPKADKIVKTKVAAAPKKSPSKVKKTTKTPVAKTPKSPKPKKIAPKKVTKKAVAKK